ncbi:hypothetical protein [Aneurinibacillus migulanus]|uniref:Uncharacterized protein n=1 Tax=Aneurinibacillus migulanus TaxID=47500 RepID=A0A0D1WJQ1_ANEMI|nr:hypothetical protein [Aneurinibacillus migulanus]KIV58850.1 hypothetical protein TS65_05750 [Aneurinibacillus migulanus]KON96543.1 hypothetical protein AF333_14740 [Aneurinibacillus migulanus]MED0890755.1 hypothetical protein [Aneurinibacillus migulanus]MED1618292.1 hypothetical protein [Aneurinibacillus migulanus]MED4727794.1 hypothetical protein [Aneurinibacillus migulanus]
MTAPEQRIEQVRQELASKGFYVEPTTAAIYAGFLEYLSGSAQSSVQLEQEINQTFILSLCGADIKAS